MGCGCGKGGRSFTRTSGVPANGVQSNVTKYPAKTAVRTSPPSVPIQNSAPTANLRVSRPGIQRGRV